MQASKSILAQWNLIFLPEVLAL